MKLLSFKKMKLFNLLFVLLIVFSDGFSRVGGSHPLIRQTCGDNAQCLEDGWEYCDKEEAGSGKGVCKHKSVFPMKGLEFWGYFGVIAILVITNVAGIGGGGTVVPVLMIFMRFDAKNAIALSNFSIFLSSLMRWIINSG